MEGQLPVREGFLVLARRMWSAWIIFGSLSGCFLYLFIFGAGFGGLELMIFSCLVGGVVVPALVRIKISRHGIEISRNSYLLICLTGIVVILVLSIAILFLLYPRN